MPSIRWDSEFPLSGNFDNVTSEFVRMGLELDLVQWVTEPTFISGNILDLVFTSSHDRIGELTVLPPFPNCGHSPIIFSYVFSMSIFTESALMNKRAWWKGKYAQVEQHLQYIDWDIYGI